MGVPTVTDSKLEKFEAGEDAVMVAMASSRVPGGMFSSNTSTLPVVHDEETGRTRSMLTPESAEFFYDEKKEGCYYYVEIFVPEDTKWEMKELQLFNEYTQETYSYDSKISKLRSEKNGYREYLIGFHFPITSYSEKDFKVTAKTTINDVDIQKSETLVGISY